MTRDRIEWRDCAEFLPVFHHAVLNLGLLEPLRDFSDSHEDSAGRAARSWSDGMVAGLSPEEALLRMTPGFPETLEELLLVGFRRSALDYVVADLIDVVESHGSEDGRERASRALLQEQRELPETTQACDACAERELRKILRRAALEGAVEVFLSQRGEQFLVQRYVAIKLVEISESSRPLVLAGVCARLDTAAQTGAAIESPDGSVDVSRLEDGRYSLRQGSQQLVLGLEECGR